MAKTLLPSAIARELQRSSSREPHLVSSPAVPRALAGEPESYTALEYEFGICRLVRALEIAVRLLESGCRRDAVALALRNALAEFEKSETTFRKTVKGELRHGNVSAS